MRRIFPYKLLNPVWAPDGEFIAFLVPLGDERHIFKMKFNGDHYELSLELKRGIYDYQYVVVNGDYKDVTNQDWIILEGNNWQTTDDLNIFLWYRDPEYGGYDKIIGYTIIQTI